MKTAHWITRPLIRGALMLAAAGAGAQTPAPARMPHAPAESAPTSPPVPPPPPALSSKDASYLMGLNFGNQLRGLGVKDAITLDSLQQGLKEGLAGKRAPAAEQQRVQSFVRAAVDSAIAHNLSASQEFLARNGREPGMQSTASGLQYKVIAPGDADAESPGVADEVTVQYRGRLLDGTEFDSSYANGRPATFGLAHVIRGWQEALVKMKPGAKWQIFIPPELGYGKSPRPEIPGGSLLIFDVELISVKRSLPTAMPAPPPQAPDPAKP